MTELITILAIETSCDETAAAVIRHDNDALSVLSNVVSSQIELHAQYGGVVPNLAAREHTRNIIPVIKEALEKANVTRDDIDAIAVTKGPGLIPALLIGISAAKTLAFVWQKPLLGIHHIEGHIYANFIGDEIRKNSKTQIPKIKQAYKDVFPLLALVVSGGHTQLVLMQDHFKYKILGETRDDAAGEAFDKVARILGLPYPGGPAIEKRASNFRDSDNQSPNSTFQINSRARIPTSKVKTSHPIIPAQAEIKTSQNSLGPQITCSNCSAKQHEKELKDDKYLSLPRPMIDSDNLDFSFSGLKTAVLYLVKENELRKIDEDFVSKVAHEFQEAVVDVLVAKTMKAIATHSPKTVIIAGGVSANEELRNRLRNSIETPNLEAKPLSTIFMVPKFKYSLDNAAMIGAAAAIRFARLSTEKRTSLKSNALTLDPDANLSL